MGDEGILSDNSEHTIRLFRTSNVGHHGVRRDNITTNKAVQKLPLQAACPIRREIAIRRQLAKISQAPYQRRSLRTCREGFAMVWLDPWVPVADFGWDEQKAVEYCRAWEMQLKREVGPQHILFGQPATLIGRRFDTDDALFQLADNKVADVHLTWSRSVEPDPRWPNTQVYNSLDEWGRTRMTEQHKDWSACEPD